MKYSPYQNAGREKECKYWSACLNKARVEQTIYLFQTQYSNLYQQKWKIDQLYVDSINEILG